MSLLKEFLRGCSKERIEMMKNSQDLILKYLEGYASSSSEISDFIKQCFKEKRTDTQLLYSLCKPLIQEMEKKFEELIEKLNNMDAEDALSILDPRALVLVRDISNDEEIRKKQQLICSYIDGYLTGSARLSKYITRLFREKHPSAQFLYRTTEPIRKKVDKKYDELVKYVNNIEKPDENSIIQCGSCEKVSQSILLVNGECPYCFSGNLVTGYIDN